MTKRKAIGILIAILLLLALVGMEMVSKASFSGVYRWRWTESNGAEGYRLYWSTLATEWPDCQVYEYDPSVCVDGTCSTGDIADPAGGASTFWMVRAYNQAGESNIPSGRAVVGCQP